MSDRNNFDLSYRCLLCPIYKRISAGFYFCEECAEEYELKNDDGKFKKPTDWPDWVRDIYNWSKRDRRRIENMLEHLVEFNDENTKCLRHSYPEDGINNHNLR